MTDSSEISDDVDEEMVNNPEDRERLREFFQQIQGRCDAASLKYARDDDEILGETLDIYLPCGNETRKITLWDAEECQRLLSFAFEKYRFLPGFEGSFSHELGVVEVALRPTGTIQSPIRRLLGVRDPHAQLTISPETPEALQPTITIGPVSENFKVLHRRAMQRSFLLEGRISPQSTEVNEQVRLLADNIFLQMDSLTGSTYILQRDRPARFGNRKPPSPEGRSLVYPNVRYNEDAISLFWYAKTARDLPLLRFLAFYQAVEFYFPRYSQAEARKRLGTILKDPTFRASREDDLDRLISVAQANKVGGFGDEKSQLRAVVNECILPEDMRAFLSATQSTIDHYSGKGKGAKYHKIPLANKLADTRNDVADRIYDIRCKIVHTKSGFGGEELPMLLPFSDEARALDLDIDLVEFVAKAVLIASSEAL